jgi:hypothetical protein
MHAALHATTGCLDAARRFALVNRARRLPSGPPHHRSPLPRDDEDSIEHVEQRDDDQVEPVMEFDC